MFFVDLAKSANHELRDDPDGIHRARPSSRNQYFNWSGYRNQDSGE